MYIGFTVASSYTVLIILSTSLSTLCWVPFLPPTALSVFMLHIFSYLLFHFSQLRLLFHVYRISAWICVWVQVCMCVGTRGDGHVGESGRRRSLLCIFSDCSLHHSLSPGLSWAEQGAEEVGCSACIWDPISSSQALVYSWVLRVRTLILPLMWQGLYPLRHLACLKISSRGPFFVSLQRSPIYKN